jgi:hypothetical protein
MRGAYVGRLKVDHSPYEAQLHGQGEDYWPTMGTLATIVGVRSLSTMWKYIFIYFSNQIQHTRDGHLSRLDTPTTST